MNRERSITENESRYLKLIYREQRETNGKIKTTTIAEHFGVRPASVTEVLKNLADKELLIYNPYRGVELTNEGAESAREQLRKHRILEVLFVNYLGYSAEKACEEALDLDYHTSKNLINSICRNFDHPEFCPCGKRIFGNPECGEVKRGV